MQLAAGTSLLVMLSHQLETQVAIEEQMNTWLEQLQNQYGEDAWKQIYDYDTEGEKYTNQPKKIVLHHTADENCDPVAISNYHSTNKKTWTNGMNSSKKMIGEFNSEVRYHYIIQADGVINEVRYEDEVGRWTRTNNIDVIHIALCGDFNQHEPTKEQYMEAGKLVGQIREKYWELPVYWHSQLEWEATACPGKLFDYEKLSFYEPMWRTKESVSKKVENAWYTRWTPDKDDKMKWCKIKDWMKCLGTFEKITAYYTPERNQTRYFSPDRKKKRTYEQEVAMNGNFDSSKWNALFGRSQIHSLSMWVFHAWKETLDRRPEWEALSFYLCR